jgi:hypothetical protein
MPGAPSVRFPVGRSHFLARLLLLVWLATATRCWWSARRAGDHRAYELLVIKYQRRIERLIGRMVRDVDLVPDIAQETFIRAWRALHQFAATPSSTPGSTASPSTRPRSR